MKQSVVALQVLQYDFPDIFNKENPKPLAIGIRHEITKHLPGLRNVVAFKLLRYWTRRIEYLNAIQKMGAIRRHLDGTVAEPVLLEHKQQAKAIIESLRVKQK